MKETKVTIINTNLNNFNARSIAKNSKGKKASEFLNIPFKIKGFVESKMVVTNTDNGQIDEYHSITFVTTTNECVGTTSQNVIDTFSDYLSDLESDGIELNTVTWEFTQQKSNNGRKYMILSAMIDE